MALVHKITHASKIVILSIPEDHHTAIVKAALQSLGCEVFVWCNDNLAGPGSLSLSFNRSGSRVELSNGDETVDAAEVRTVWNRRGTTIAAPDYVADDDRGFVTKQLRCAVSALKSALRAAFWVNPEKAAEHAERKTLQLEQAQLAGLATPETLVSNDPAAIRRFLTTFAKVIYKPLRPHAWSGADAGWSLYTATVTLGDLPSDRLLRASPGIYQSLAAKAFEVRAQFFGNACLAVRIDSPSLAHGEHDWRRSQSAIAAAETIQVPETIQARCREVLQRLGLVAGAFDFIVRPDGEWMFLEVNQAGQFLFMERWAPTLPVLDAFCRFLLANQRDFTYTPTCDALSLRNFQRKRVSPNSA